MSENSENIKSDTGLLCLVMIAKYYGLTADEEQIRHAFAIDHNGMNWIDIIKAAKEIGLKAKMANMEISRLEKMKLPAILELKDGKFWVLAKIDNGKYLVFNPEENRPQALDEEILEEIWSGKIILVGEKGIKLKNEVFGIKWFLPSIWKYRKPLGEVLIAAFTMQIMGLGSPLIMQVIIDKVLVHKGLSTLDVLACGLLIVILFETVLSIAKNYVFTHTTNKIDVILGARLFKHLFALPLRYFELRRVGDTMARVREIENIRNFLTGAPLSSILDVMFIFVYIIVMFFYSPLLTVITLASLPFFIVLSVVVTPMFKHRLDEKFKTGAEQQSYIVEAVTGVQTIKSFALEPIAQRKWEGLLANYVKASFKTSILSGNAGSIGQLIQKTSDLVILWIGARMVMEGKITIGQLIAFRMLSGRVSGPVLRLVQLWQEFQQIGVSIERIGDIFNSKPEPTIDPSRAKLPDIAGQIKFESVRFRYRMDAAEVIRNMSFEIEKGRIVGIVGRSGSGKSTISKLIQRMYIPEMGKILIDGVDISLADPAWLRRQVGVVLQENFLFTGSIKENISIHRPSATMEEIIYVAQLAGAHDFILETTEGYDTLVGEKGVGLSGGQKQRVAIARALLSNPKVLIFDEATSALDYESESIIQKNLRKICAGRTVIIIAHRLSTLKDADYIMAIDKGELIEYGQPKDLLEKKGLYHYLYTSQERGDV